MSDADLVKKFTEETGNVIPATPQLMSREEVFFLIKMMLDELCELSATVAEPGESKYIMVGFIKDSKDIPKVTGSDIHIIAEQGDALVDCYYYSLNAASKKGINLSKIFRVVHGANMAKRDPVSGTFLRRDDGKIIKPDGWKAPDIDAEIIRQMKFGSFNDEEVIKDVVKEGDVKEGDVKEHKDLSGYEKINYGKNPANKLKFSSK